MSFYGLKSLKKLFKTFPYKSSHPEVFLGKGVLKICSKVTRENSRRSVVSICDIKKVAKQLYCNHSLTWVHSSKFAAYFQNAIFLITPLDG